MEIWNSTYMFNKPFNNNDPQGVSEIITQISVTCYNKTQQAQLLHPLYVDGIWKSTLSVAIC